MTTKFNTVIILLALAGTASAAEPQAAFSGGGQVVARHSFDINAPAGGPSGGMANGPLIGNGDVGVQQTGPADAFIFFIGKSDFWSGDSRNERGEVCSAPRPVGQVRLATRVPIISEVFGVSPRVHWHKMSFAAQRNQTGHLWRMVVFAQPHRADRILTEESVIGQDLSGKKFRDSIGCESPAWGS